MDEVNGPETGKTIRKVEQSPPWNRWWRTLSDFDRGWIQLIVGATVILFLLDWLLVEPFPPVGSDGGQSGRLGISPLNAVGAWLGPILAGLVAVVAASGLIVVSRENGRLRIVTASLIILFSVLGMIGVTEFWTSPELPGYAAHIEGQVKTGPGVPAAATAFAVSIAVGIYAIMREIGKRSGP